MLNFDTQKLVEATRAVKANLPLDQASRAVSFMLAKLLGFAAPIPTVCPSSRKAYYDENIAQSVNEVLDKLIEVVPFDISRVQDSVLFVWKMRVALVHNPLTISDAKLADAFFNCANDAEFGCDYRDLFMNAEFTAKIGVIFERFLSASNEETPEQPN